MPYEMDVECAIDGGDDDVVVVVQHQRGCASG